MIYSYPESPGQRMEAHQQLDIIKVVKLEEFLEEDFRFILKLALQGNEKAWNQLFQSYEPGLLKEARELLGPLLRSEVEAEDLVQAVHWSLLSGLRLGKIEVDSVEALLSVGRTILKRKVARTWRTLQRRKRLSNQVNDRFGRANNGDDCDQSIDDPADQISADEQFERLCGIMTRTERRLIELRMQGYTTAAAAREMGRDSEGLRVTLARLRSKLKNSGLLSDFLATSTQAE